LAEDFVKYRTATGQINIVADTRPGGTFDLSGRFDVIMTEQPPFDLDTRGYQNCLPYRMDEFSKIVGVSIMDGVSSLTPLRNTNPMISPLVVSDGTVQQYSSI
jgi:hypothetical protein